MVFFPFLHRFSYNKQTNKKKNQTKNRFRKDIALVLLKGSEILHIYIQSDSENGTEWDYVAWSLLIDHVLLHPGDIIKASGKLPGYSNRIWLNKALPQYSYP